MTKIVFEKVSKFYGNKQVLKDFDLEIQDRELMVLLGPSGAGKSTILKLIAGIEEPTSGNILFDGRIVNRLHPRERDVSLVFQSYALYPNKTVYENLAFPLENRGMAKPEIDAAINEISAKLAIDHVLEKHPGTLSGGERQRVALARAMIRKPKVYLFDEPLTNLDAKLRVITRTEIKRLQRELKATTVYATPDQLEATTIADRITVLDDGVIAQVDTPSNLYHNPVNTTVATFIGSPAMNFIRCSTEVGNRTLTLCFDEVRYEIDFQNNEQQQINFPKEVLLGIRPEDLKVSKGGDTGISAKVLVVEPTRPEMIAYLEMGKSQVLALIPPTHELKLNEDVKVSFEKSKVRIFDANSGRALRYLGNGQSKNRESR